MMRTASTERSHFELDPIIGPVTACRLKVYLQRLLFSRPCCVPRVSEIGWWRSRLRANCRRWRTTLDSCVRRSLSSNNIRRRVTRATNWPSFDDGRSLTVARIFVFLFSHRALSGMLTIVVKSASIILKIHRFHRFSRNGLPVSPRRTTFLEQDQWLI